MHHYLLTIFESIQCTHDSWFLYFYKIEISLWIWHERSGARMFYADKTHHCCCPQYATIHSCTKSIYIERLRRHHIWLHSSFLTNNFHLHLQVNYIKYLLLPASRKANFLPYVSAFLITHLPMIVMG